MILNFKEIPQANGGDGNQDTFELFARDFLENLGYTIIQQPNRGADGKKDMIVEEYRSGIVGSTTVRWLVSCKHYAHSGKSVSDTDEPDIRDRVAANACHGFLGVYSTLPATSLGTKFNSLKTNMEIVCFDKEAIEKRLLNSPSGLNLARRYFPESFEKYRIENPTPVKIFSGDGVIICECCRKNLLEEKNGIFVTVSEIPNGEENIHVPTHYLYAYYSCKGRCDDILEKRYTQNGRLWSEWSDISDYLSPATYMKRLMGWMNAIHSRRETLSQEAFEKLKMLLIRSFQYISREQTTEEKEYIKFYLENGFAELI